ncbi:hypothetical protein EJ05DRAFT_477099 [Pseudovirgaria hyperparasitica]|uniref:Uncharacterized protein n=1 Tax=Pseudovirgaria hyperparasitica TaxID=470096 RepID=A0A6A6W1S5_9PEZI|nr:uncharacterized protein EJ05DRAFT_477099 [Pseudovirgaria hyperparasitica]KAF2756868.1 hypothetical protein EJ05DRAFT_477099 [Pseudovirgaria hyperparasitica]
MNPEQLPSARSKASPCQYDCLKAGDPPVKRISCYWCNSVEILCHIVRVAENERSLAQRIVTFEMMDSRRRAS